MFPIKNQQPNGISSIISVRKSSDNTSEKFSNGFGAKKDDSNKQSQFGELLDSASDTEDTPTATGIFLSADQSNTPLPKVINTVMARKAYAETQKLSEILIENNQSVNTYIALVSGQICDYRC